MNTWRNPWGRAGCSLQGQVTAGQEEEGKLKHCRGGPGSSKSEEGKKPVFKSGGKNEGH